MKPFRISKAVLFAILVFLVALVLFYQFLISNL